MGRPQRKPRTAPVAGAKGLRPTGPHPAEGRNFEAQVLDGLKLFAQRELARLGPGVSLEPGDDAEAVPFRYEGLPSRLAELRTAVAVYLTGSFEVPRPKALLGDQHLRRLVGLVAEVRAGGGFESFRLSAAGRDTAVFSRLAAAIGEASGLAHDPEEGDLLMRVRPASGASGWEVLVRLTPRPLSARPWRVCNMPGGLNATVAAAMLDCAPARGGARVLNLMCGSGTLLAERHAQAPAARLVGVDIDARALACARENLQAAGAEAELVEGDATALGVAAGSFDLVLADPPWGDQIGSHDANARLYPALLEAAGRVAAPGAHLVLLSHEVRLLGRLLAAQSAWRLMSSHRVYHGGHYPRIYALERA